MLSLSLVFWIFVTLFALIGAMRGWAKELRVTFSMILVLFIIQLIAQYLPWASSNGPNTVTPFYLWLVLVVIFAFAGYHIPDNVQPKNSSKLQDYLLGCIIGACNGYLLVGTIWFYLDTAGYPFHEHMLPPKAGTTALKLIVWLPPAWLNVPIAVAIAFTIIVIVFI